MRTGLRARVAIGFALLSLAVAIAVSVPTYLLTQYYLTVQRERAAVTRTVLNAGQFVAGLREGQSPLQSMQDVPIVGVSRAFAVVDGAWVANGGPVLPMQTPIALRQQSPGTGATQRFPVKGEPYLGVAIGIPGGTYVEVFPLAELVSALATTRAVLIATTAIAAVVGALLGFLAAGALLRPLQRIAGSAKRIAEGDLSSRIETTRDGDLQPIVTALNEMIEAVQEQLQRERRFSANVSHELRSPLTAVVGTAELLRAKADALPPREADLVRVLDEQVARLSRMLLDLLEIAKVTASGQESVHEPVDLAVVGRTVLREHAVDGETVPIVGSAVVMSDARRIERILGNLVGNAALHGGGVVSVRIQSSNGSVDVAVEDAGPGVAMKDRERLFEPFARGDEAMTTAGAGLGLAIAREQAAFIGGSLSIEDAPGGGARFVLHLPVEG